MEVRFADSQLDRLERDPAFDGGLSQALVRGFRRRMQQIRAAMDERTFYNIKSLHYEKLKGDKAHQRSLRINDQWRLVIELEGEAPNKRIIIVGIEDYH